MADPSIEVRTATVEKDVVSLRAGDSSSTDVLDRLVRDQHETAKALESLRLSAWPPASYILGVVGWCAALITSFLGGIMFLISVQVAAQTAPLVARLNALEANLEITYRWRDNSKAIEIVKP